VVAAPLLPPLFGDCEIPATGDLRVTVDSLQQSSISSGVDAGYRSMTSGLVADPLRRSFGRQDEQ
jgi:hypothetical protein